MWPSATGTFRRSTAICSPERRARPGHERVRPIACRVVKRISPRLGAVLIVPALLVGAFLALREGDTRPEMTLDELLAQVEAGNVETADVQDRSQRISGELADGTSYRAMYPEQYAEEMTGALLAAGVRVEVDTEQRSFTQEMLMQLLPIVLIVGVFLVFLMRMQGGRMRGFGRNPLSRSKDSPTVKFTDVAGCDEAIEELQEIKDFLRSPERFASMGAKIPRGVLLVGPPGTGKTLLARAVAGEADVPFFSLSGSDFVELFVGVGASRVRDLFSQAKSAAPSIIFVDEIDAVGRHRGAGVGGGHDEREQTLNQLLVEMDGFDARTGVILIAATNRPDILDPALLRPGRFDRQIVVDAPDMEGRASILTVHSMGKPMAGDVDLRVLARRTPGFTGADLANLMNEAALLAARRELELIGRAELEDAMDRVMAGPERRSRVMSDHERQVTAYHEAGHALVGHVLEHSDPIHKVSIVARGRALGWTQSLPTEDRHVRTRSELLDRLGMYMGGRVAEHLVFGERTTGASDDIRRATEIARAMVTEYGMSDAVGPRQLGRVGAEVFLGKEVSGDLELSQEISARVDGEVDRLLLVAEERATAVLMASRDVLDRVAAALLEHETLADAELAELLAEAAPHAPPAVFRRITAEAGKPSGADTGEVTESAQSNASRIADVGKEPGPTGSGASRASAPEVPR